MQLFFHKLIKITDNNTAMLQNGHERL